MERHEWQNPLREDASAHVFDLALIAKICL